MDNLNIHMATENEVKENIRKQGILLEHGINVKVDGSWGPMARKSMDQAPKTNKKGKNAEIRKKD